MTWESAKIEAENRIAFLLLPPEPAPLDGLHITLIEFETRELAGLLVGGYSAEYQRMVNRAATRLLKSRGATVEVKIITLAETMVWEKGIDTHGAELGKTAEGSQ